MFQRFIERYQFWREEKAQEDRGKNPLSGLAIIAILLIALDVYKTVSSHHVTWRPVFNDVVLVTFLVLYLRHSRLAWLVIPIFGVLCLVQAPILYFSSAWHYPVRVRVLSLCIGLALGVVALAYGFVARRKYELYLDDRSAGTPNI
jgi:hypothetical protein